MGMVITMFHVCILDDDPAFSAQLHTVLDDYFTDHKLSFEIDVYHSSEECLKALARTETSYQLYFLDILMPGKQAYRLQKIFERPTKLHISSF
jgi:CheY-like chemotaxis protein